jgi:hypothetical protein
LSDEGIRPQIDDFLRQNAKLQPDNCGSKARLWEEQAHEVMPRVHNVASLLKRWLLGALQRGVQQQDLDYYVDEFRFRFKRRAQTRGDCSYTALPNKLSPSVRRPTVPWFPADVL